MKNVGTLFGYEMKKIWKRPMIWIAVLVFSAVFVYYAPIPLYNYGHILPALGPGINIIWMVATHFCTSSLNFFERLSSFPAWRYIDNRCF